MAPESNTANFSRGHPYSVGVRYLVLFALFAACSLIYYFGEIVDFFGWQSLRWEYWYSLHDVHRLLFFIPIVWAGFFLSTKGVIITTSATLLVFLPRAIWISPFPYSLPRAMFDGIIEGAVGYSVAKISAARRNNTGQTRAKKEKEVSVRKENSLHKEDTGE